MHPPTHRPILLRSIPSSGSRVSLCKTLQLNVSGLTPPPPKDPPQPHTDLYSVPVSPSLPSLPCSPLSQTHTPVCPFQCPLGRSVRPDKDANQTPNPYRMNVNHLIKGRLATPSNGSPYRQTEEAVTWTWSWPASVIFYRFFFYHVVYYRFM